MRWLKCGESPQWGPARPSGNLGVAPPAAVAWSFGLILVADLQRELLGVLDPAHDQLLGWKKAYKPLLLVGLRHRAREILGLAIAQFPHRIHPHFLQQAQIALTHALDTHVVASVG